MLLHYNRKAAETYSNTFYKLLVPQNDVLMHFMTLLQLVSVATMFQCQLKTK